MNYFAHAFQRLDDPYLVAGTAVPDWLSVADRQCRVRRRTAEPWLADPDPHVAAVARGVLCHLADDARFHSTRAFAESSLALTGLVRRVLDDDKSFRAGFLGHLLVELLLDATLIARWPDRLAIYQELLDSVDPDEVQRAVNQMARQPSDRLATFIRLFCRERILEDYLEDQRLLVRLDQVMRRVGFAPLPPAFLEVLPEARRLVSSQEKRLLDGIPAAY